jgi:lipoprotein NlpD
VGISSLIRHICIVSVLVLLISACTSAGHRNDHASQYHVRSGETLFSIAWRHGLDYKDVARWNGISPPYKIYKGQKLWLVPRTTASTKKKSSSSSNKSAKTTKSKKTNKASTSSRASPKTQSTDARYIKGKIKWVWPHNGKIIKKYNNSSPGKKGIDIAGKTGQPVSAAASGKVVYSGTGLKGYGKLLIIKHNNNYFSAYAHNNKILVREGSWVKQGQKVAQIGSTDADRPMLHFEIRRNGKPVNPVHYLPGR